MAGAQLFLAAALPPLRPAAFFWAVVPPCLPRALRVLAGMLAIERFCFAPAWAFLTFRPRA